MVDTAIGPGPWGAGEDWGMRCIQAVSEPKQRLDRLVPLLHEMVAWDLVHRSEDGSFVLREDVQERLDLLTAERPLRSAQVYVGRKCEACGRVCVTRMVDGARICSTCNRASPPEPEGLSVSGSDAAKNHRAAFHWRRKAG